MQKDASTDDIIKVIKGSALKCMIPQMVRLLQLYLIVPSTTATAERSFSQLGRIKNYLRSTMTQERLNSCMILAVYKEEVQDLNLPSLINEFILSNDMRLNTFALL